MTEEKPQQDMPEILPGLATQATRGRRFAAVAGLTLAALFSGFLVAGIVIATLEGGGSVVTQTDLLAKLKTLSQEKDPKAETLKELVANERKRLAENRAAPAAGVVTLLAQLEDVLQAPDVRTERLREIYREEDARIRREHLFRQRTITVGAVLLVGTLGAMVACARWYVSLDRRLPTPPKYAPSTNRSRSLGVAAAVAIAALLVAVLAGLFFLKVPAPPTEPDRQPVKGPVDVKPPTPVQYKDNWPAFRGPTGMGTAPAADWPTTWNAKTGENILWKTPLPLDGNSSPVLYGPRVFLTAADDRTQLVLCCDRTDGRILWQREISSDANKRRLLKGEEGALLVNEDTGYAAPTGVTDGKLLYVLFATGDYAAVDLDGNVKWVKNLSPVENSYGLSSSLAMNGDLLVLMLDRSEKPTLYGIDAASGEVIWPTERPGSGSWGSPVVTEVDGKRLILTATNPAVIAYDAVSGEELWRCEGLSGDVAASPVYVGGLVFAADPMQVIAVRAGGSGDVTDTHTAWVSDETATDAPTPVTDGKLLLVTQNQSADAVCLDAKTGKLLWKQTFKSGYYASPVLADDVVYLVDVKGRAQVFRLTEQWTGLIAANEFGEEVYASPAFGDGRIYVRGKKHLFCIGKSPAMPREP